MYFLTIEYGVYAHQGKDILMNLLQGLQHTTFSLLFLVIIFSKMNLIMLNEKQNLLSKAIINSNIIFFKFLYRNKSLIVKVCVTG